MTTDIFKPASKRNPCPVCNRPTGCLIASEGSTVAAICSRTESRQRIGTLGHLHLVVDRGPIWATTRHRVLKAARMLREDSEN